MPRVWNPNVDDLHKYILDLEAEVERLKDCHDPLDPCRSCIKCLTEEVETQVRIATKNAEAALAQADRALMNIRDATASLHLGKEHTFAYCHEQAQAALEGRG